MEQKSKKLKKQWKQIKINKKKRSNSPHKSWVKEASISSFQQSSDRVIPEPKRRHSSSGSYPNKEDNTSGYGAPDLDHWYAHAKETAHADIGSTKPFPYNKIKPPNNTSTDYKILKSHSDGSAIDYGNRTANIFL